MLLTKPISTFLNANRSPHIHTLLLVTPTGKLLSSSSSAPVSLLRNQATIACSVWDLYGPITTASTISTALPADFSSDNDDEGSGNGNGGKHDDHEDGRMRQASDPAISSILIQLESGIMAIRALRCSLLFVVVGPSPAMSPSVRALAHGTSFLSVSSPVSPPASSHSQTNGDGSERRRDGSSTNLNGLGAGPVGPTAPIGASVKVVGRLAEELAKCLDVELEGFVLSSGL